MTDNETLIRLREDFQFFLLHLWKFLRLPAPTRAQYALARELQHGSHRGCTMGFRGLGKSWVTAAFVLWLLWNHRDRRVLVISANTDRAVAFSVFCKRIISEWPLLRDMVPDKGARDSLESWDVGGAGPHQANSVMSVGITGMMTGKRATDIIYDDVEVPKNSLTVVMRARLSELVKEAAAVLCSPEDPAAYPRGGDSSQSILRIRYLGTPQCEDTIYAKLPERGYSVRIWPGRYPDKELVEAYANFGGLLFDELTTDLLEDADLVGQPTDPGRFDESDLFERELEYGNNGFQLQYMLNPSLADSEKYPLKVHLLPLVELDSDLGPQMVAWGRDKELIDETLSTINVALAGDHYYNSPSYKEAGFAPWEGTHMAIDPAGGGKDETAYAITSFLNGAVFLRDIGAYKSHGADELVLYALANAAKEFNVRTFSIESNMGDGMYTRLLSPIMQEIHGRGLDPEEVDVRNTIQKERRIIDTLGPIMRRHRLVVDPAVIRKDFKLTHKGEEPAKQQNRRLFYQMTRLTEDRGCLAHDDRLDALALGVAHWAERVAVDQIKAVAKRKEKDVKKIAESNILAGTKRDGWKDKGGSRVDARRGMWRRPGR